MQFAYLQQKALYIFLIFLRTISEIKCQVNFRFKKKNNSNSALVLKKSLKSQKFFENVNMQKGEGFINFLIIFSKKFVLGSQ